MLELDFTPADVANTRFAISPLWELVAAVRLLNGSEVDVVYRRWRSQVAPRLLESRLNWRLLADLVPQRHIPGFLAPPPSTAMASLGLELEQLRATPPEQVRGDLDDLEGPRTADLANLYERPEERLAELSVNMETFWDIAISPWWPRIKAALEGDIFFRARQMAEGGAEKLLNDIDSGVAWEDGRLVVPRRFRPHRIDLQGRGLLLVPSFFIHPHIFSITSPPYQPTVRYPARGIATVWEGRAHTRSEQLGALIGQTRARLLIALDEPLSGNQLAGISGLTDGGVSQHMKVLREAGLVSAHRSGRSVLWSQTEVGKNLIDATENPPS